MKFVWEELYDGIQSIVSRCWLDVNGHGLPPTYTPVLAACEVDNNRTVYAAMVDQSGEWLIPEFQGDPRDVTVLMWMPKPQISMRVDTAFALNSDMLEAVTIGINKEAELATRLAAMTARAEAAEAASRQRCLTYTEAKKIVKAWRQDFACNVSEEYIINAFLDDAIVIKKLRAELATTQTELANTQLRLDSWLESLAIQRQRSETAEAAEAEREVFCALLLLDALSFISDFNRRNDILAPSMSQLRLKVREYFRNAIDIAGDNRMLMRATPEAAARVRELLDAYVEPKEGQP